MRESRSHPHAKIADFSMCALQFILQQRCGAVAKDCLCNAYLTPRLANPQELTTPPRSRAGGFAGHGDSAMRQARRLGHAPIVDARLHQQSRAADRASRPTRSRSRRHSQAASNHAAFAGIEIGIEFAFGAPPRLFECLQQSAIPRPKSLAFSIREVSVVVPPSKPRKSPANHCRHPASIHSARC